MGSEMLALLRPKLWLELTGARDLKLSAKINYHDMSACTTDEKTVEDWLELTGAGYTFDAMYKSRKQVEKDLPRTSTDVSKNDEFCFKNKQSCIKTRNLVSKMMHFADDRG